MTWGLVAVLAIVCLAGVLVAFELVLRWYDRGGGR